MPVLPNPVPPKAFFADLNRGTPTGERVHNYLERLGIQVEQIIKPAYLRVSEMTSSGCLLLLLPDVVDRRVEIGQVRSSGFQTFWQLCHFV
jgi:hypothetical protein